MQQSLTRVWRAERAGAPASFKRMLGGSLLEGSEDQFHRPFEEA
jgi:hypothetical protein